MNKQSTENANPPRWLECLLLLALKRRDREAVSGDLLEEYRAVILPARGAWPANLWYLKQTLSLLDSFRFGVVLGGGLGLFNLILTVLAPFAEDTPLGVGTFFGAVMFLWGLSGFGVARRTGRLLEAAKAGASVGAISMGLFHITVIVRLNLFLETVSQRSDWQGLIFRFQQSGFESLRWYANYTYLQQGGVILILGVLVGGICGALGGLIALLARGTTQPSSS